MEKIQFLLEKDESCKHCIEGSLMSGWSRSPHFFALVESAVGNYGLLVLSHPGIGSNEVSIRSKHALPIDRGFNYISNDNSKKQNSDFQVQLCSNDKVLNAEFTWGPGTDQFLQSITDHLCKDSLSNGDFSWLKKYENADNNGSWPWSEINKPSENVSTPVVFDGGVLESFDPLAVDKKVDDEVSNDLLHDFENISKPVDELALQDDFDLKDFDPLSQSEIEKGIQTERMLNSDLLKRSREVVSISASAGKSWIERTLSQVSHGSERQGDSRDKLFDVVDSSDVINNHPAMDSPLLTTTHHSTVLKGIRARENYIRHYMLHREKEFTELFPFRIFTGTWNVNGQPAAENISDWLSFDPEPPDVFAIGFQELDLSAEALVFNASSCEESWLKAIEKALPKKADYFKLKHVRLVGMLLVVYVQTKHKMQVHNVEAETNATGIMGMMGNKGGVAVRLQLHNSTICLVNSHLAAHLLEYERRNQDFREVYSKLKFTLHQPQLSICDHDMVFWMGDLNYRFDSLDPEQVKKLVNDVDYMKLYSYDQLNTQRSARKVFKGFSEGQILFKPTYKYDPGTDQWDSSEKSRAPAWCDRILWKGKNIEQLSYRSHPPLKLSDHKPVSALFKVGIKVVDRTNERRVFEEIVRKLDRKENESLPQVKLGRHEFQFDEVKFMEERLQILPVANIGQSPVEFQFIPKLDETNVAKPWIRVNPTAGFIMPGDVLEIELSILVDKLSAPLVTLEKYRLDDILVLHLVDGKDFFVPINGTFKPSVFGSYISLLVRIYGPICQVSTEKLIKHAGLCNSDEMDGSHFANNEPLEIPKELWLLIDHLHKYGMTQENVLLQNGIDEEIIKIRYHLDSGRGGRIPGSIFSIGEALLLFLEALVEPVIPYQYQLRCLEACNNYVLCKQVISQLPDCHGNMFRYLTAFLRELLKQSAENKLDAKLIAAVFGSILLRSPFKFSQTQNKRSQSQQAQKKAKFVYHFLVNDFRD